MHLPNDFFRAIMQILVVDSITAPCSKTMKQNQANIAKKYNDTIFFAKKQAKFVWNSFVYENHQM